MSKDWYIWLDGIKVPVTEEVYRTYKRAEWREEKQDTVRKERECSLDFMAEYGFDGQAVTKQKLIDEIVADKLLLDELYKALAELTDDERYLINELFFKEKSERDVAAEVGIPQTTINYQKNRILKWLKKKLINL